MPKGYTSPADVGRHIGRALTADQSTYVTGTLLDAAESFIDSYVGGGYAAGPILGEIVQGAGPYYWLRYAPLATVERVQGYIGSLFAVSNYAITDPSTSQLFVPGWRNYAYLSVDYTPAPIPAMAKLAATMLVAHWLKPALDPNGYGNHSYTLGQDLRVQKEAPSDVPPEVLAVLDRLGGGVGVA